MRPRLKGKPRISERDYEIYALCCQRRLSYGSIGKQYSLSRQRIAAIADEVDASLEKHYAERAIALKVHHTQVLDGIVLDALRSFDDSKGERVKTVERDRVSKAGKQLPPLVERTIDHSPGQPQFLAKALDALADIRRIWGAEAPQKLETSSTDGDMPYLDQLAAINHRLHDLLPGQVEPKSLPPPAEEPTDAS